uniref:Uncharacterized protein n=1 Tax=Anguilla anguilla TaxID=7936 RepID=A0A0E9UVJ2_ANGAN
MYTSVYKIYYHTNVCRSEYSECYIYYHLLI